ncbi:MAG: aromatic amino acid lyase, partial [Betaproteobacteria bacterium]
ALHNQRVAVTDLRSFQRALVMSHCAGYGEPFSVDIARAVMLLRAHTLARGHSGVRPELIDRLLDMLNAGVTPVIPQQGSVGASGDLAPLAYVAATMMGLPEAQATIDGQILPAPEALRLAGLSADFEFEAKDPTKARARSGRPTTALKVLGPHPKTKAPVELHSGKYGPYVKHGAVNATLPDSDKAETLTLEEALDILAEKTGKPQGGKTKRAAKPAAKKPVARKATKAEFEADAPVANIAAKPAVKKTVAKKPTVRKPAAKKT